MTYEDMTLEEVIQLAMEREVQARDLYLGVLEQVQDDVVQGLLRAEGEEKGGAVCRD